jgi:branched-chain amino acid transport system ATP-binding protein
VTTLLDVREASTAISGHLIVHRVSLTIDDGEAVGLIGANGAGKTTLFRMIAGELPLTSGEILYRGEPLPSRPDARARLGLARTFQLVQLFGGLTVLDHLLVALQGHERTVGPLRDLRGDGATTPTELAHCEEILELCGLTAAANAPATALSLGERRAVELARALVGRPRLLLADEPSSGLDADEALALGAAITRVRQQTGLAVLLVEHDLATVQATTERVVAMDAGSVIASGPLADVVRNPQVIESWLGSTV